MKAMNRTPMRRSIVPTDYPPLVEWLVVESLDMTGGTGVLAIPPLEVSSDWKMSESGVRICPAARGTLAGLALRKPMSSGAGITMP